LLLASAGFSLTLIAGEAAPAPAPPPPPPPPPVAPIPAPAPEVSWDAIEAWASGTAELPPAVVATPAPAPAPAPAPGPASGPPPGPAPAKTETANKPEPKPPESKTPELPPIDMRPGVGPKSTRQEPRQIAALREKFLRVNSKIAEIAENKRDYDTAWRWNYRCERYTQAMQNLYMMTKDKHSSRFVQDGTLADRILMTHYMFPQISRQDVDKALGDWKAAAIAAIKEREAADPKFKDREKADLDQVTRHENFHLDAIKVLDAGSNLTDYLHKFEVAGETDPRYLVDVGLRYAENTPAGPLHLLSVLYKMKEWYPEHEAVKNGEVQWRLIRVLSEELWLYKEAADEAAYMIETYPKNGQVQAGEVLWTEAENRHRQGDAEYLKKDQMPIWYEARNLFRQFKEKYPRHQRNQPGPNNSKPACQGEIETLDGKIPRTYSPPGR
jgi:hypothetical protein